MQETQLTAIIDLDDLCDQWDPFPMLATLKENDEAFKITLFTIPRRCSRSLIRRYQAHRDWIELAVHGWWHTTGETLSWTPEEAQAKMTAAHDMGIDGKGFKAPKWIISEAARQAARELGWYVADHKSNRWRPKHKDDRIYITDLKLRDSKELRLHGHTHNVTGNGIEEAFNTFLLPRGKVAYRFISEVC